MALESSACTITVQDESEPATPNFSLEGVAEEESTIADDVFTEEVDTRPANLPSSFSSDELLTAGGYARPTSVFSVESSASMQEFTEYSVTTLPRVKPKTRVRTYSADVTRRLWNIGVNHFNRYVVSGYTCELVGECTYVWVHVYMCVYACVCMHVCMGGWLQVYGCVCIVCMLT